MSTNTLTSLAILKVNVDHGRDYLEYLRPFILQILVDRESNVVSVKEVRNEITEQFGLIIPERTIQILINRIARSGLLVREYGVYRKNGELPDPQITAQTADIQRHITAVLNDLKKYSKHTAKPICSTDDAVNAVCTFLAKFDVTCLRAYLRGTAIPYPKESHESDVVLVSDYVRHIQTTNPGLFDSFQKLVQGHMLANALLCPDLKEASKSYHAVTFVLDTPLVIHALGIEGQEKKNAIVELMELLKSLNGALALFSHSREELERVLQNSADSLDPNTSTVKRTPIAIEADRTGVTRSDLLLLAASLDEELRKLEVNSMISPNYEEKFQIDEMEFENFLDDEVSYNNPKAKEYDINSVRSIYVLRGNNPAPSLEKCHYVFVTSNSAFAKAAWRYGQRHESAKQVSSVIGDITLANMAWLKKPVAAKNLPTTQLLAFAYAALVPTSRLLNKYMNEIEKLERSNIISPDYHQLLRSSPHIYNELMRYTLGDDANLSGEAVMTALERVMDQAKEEERRKLNREKEAHELTIKHLKDEKKRRSDMLINLKIRCRKKAMRSTRFITVVLVLALVIGNLPSFRFEPPISYVIGACSVLLIVASILNLTFGTTLKSIYQKITDRWYRKLVKYECRNIGASLEEIEELLEQETE